MKTYFTTFLLIMFSIQSQASSILASSYGWNGVDDTQALEDGFMAGYDTLIIDLQSGNWVTGPLIFHYGDGTDIHNLTVIFEPGVVVEAKPGAFDDYPYDGLLNFFKCTYINLFGYGATLQMNKQEYIDLNDGSQWRHGISISGCENVKVHGLEILDTGGDGIEVAGIFQQPIASKNVQLLDCKIDNAFRNGVSITSCEECWVEHCEIINTNGQNPQFGIDVEPNHWYDTSKDIFIRNCRIVGNQRGGIKLEYWKMSPSSTPFAVTIEDCYIADSYYGIDIDVWTDSLAYGHIDIERCIVENIAIEGINSHKRNSSSFKIKDCVFRNVAQDDFDEHGQDVYPFRIVGIGAAPGEDNWVGNFIFENVLLDQQEAEDFFVVVHWGQALGAKDIEADFTVLNPNGSSYYVEGTQVNVNVETTELMSMPTASLEISSSNTIAYETGADTTASFSVSRSASNVTFPLPVFYETSGIAENCLDYHYAPQALVIPANVSQKQYSIIANKDDMIEGLEAFDIDLQTDNYYSILQGNVALNIDEEAVLAVEYLAPLRARLFDNGVLLNWSTTSEQNNEHFIIQRSQNAAVWKNIGQVNGRGNTYSTNSYKGVDSFPPTGILYYRLKQVDFNGRTSFSNIASVYFEQIDFSFSPNPSSGLVDISFSKFQEGSLILYNELGKQVFKKEMLLPETSLDLSHLPSGVYSISFQTNGSMINKKLILNR